MIERRPPLNQRHVTRFADALRVVLGKDQVTALGRSTGHCQRLREITPQRLVCALLESLGGGRARSISDVLHTFNAQNDTAVRYKPFHNQLVKAAFPAFVRRVYAEAVRHLSQKVLRAALGGRLGAFTDIVVQDGSSFAVHDALAEVFPGRFNASRPAAVELHALMSIFHDEVVRCEVAPDTQGERDFLPRPEDLKGKLLLGDRGYESLDSWRRVDREGGFFLIRGTSKLNPRIVRFHGGNPRQRQHFEGRRLDEVREALPHRRLDLDVEWDLPGGETLRLRMVLVWTVPKDRFLILVTNVARTILTARRLTWVYRLRWQIELVFKEWKSYTNLHEFVSRKRALVEGLIWASLCAAALKRALAHVTQRCEPEAPISTMITAACGAHILPGLLRCALRRFKGLLGELERIVRFLNGNAQRAHPERDRRHGRMQFGLDYVGLTA
jgi:hypothetical protein